MTSNKCYRLRAAKVRFSQILEYTLCTVQHEQRKEKKEEDYWGHIFTIPQCYELHLACQRALYFITVDWSLTMRIK